MMIIIWLLLQNIVIPDQNDHIFTLNEAQWEYIQIVAKEAERDHRLKKEAHVDSLLVFWNNFLPDMPIVRQRNSSHTKK